MRTFIAADIPDEARESLALALSQVQGMEMRELRWVQPQGIHLTLKFLGEIGEDSVGPVLEAMGRTCEGESTFPLSTGGLGCFPSRKSPQVVWLGLEGEMETLGQLQGKLDEEVHRGAGLPLETRPFRPHLTLGRVRRGVSETERRRIWEAIDSIPPLDKISWQVSQLSLVHSTLLPQGAHYRTLGTATLGE